MRNEIYYFDFAHPVKSCYAQNGESDIDFFFFFTICATYSQFDGKLKYRLQFRVEIIFLIKITLGVKIDSINQRRL